MTSTPRAILNVSYFLWLLLGFYFKVGNTLKGKKVKFNILNLSKPTSLYNKGMKVLIYSRKKYEHEQMGWHRGCTNISYSKNNYRKVNLQTWWLYRRTLDQGHRIITPWRSRISLSTRMMKFSLPIPCHTLTLTWGITLTNFKLNLQWKITLPGTNYAEL